MKKGVCTIVMCLCVTHCCFAQNELFSRQYFLNNYLVNPAVGGLNDYMDARLSYSKQWAAIDNSPQSILFTFNTNLAKEKDQVLRYSYAEKRYKIERGGIDHNYRRIKHGIGFKLIYDKVNVFTYTNALLSYACHVPLNPYFTLSVGIGGGLALSSMDLNDEYVGDITDPLYQTGKRTEFAPVVEAGLWLYSTGPFVGGSLSRYVENPYEAEGQTQNNIYAVAGWQLYVNQISFVPSVMYRHNEYTDTGIDVNVMLWYADVVWMGASLRNFENTSVHGGVLIKNMFELNYTYDVNGSEWGGSHEVGLAVRIWKRANECKNKWYFK